MLKSKHLISVYTREKLGDKKKSQKNGVEKEEDLEIVSWRLEWKWGRERERA